MKHIMHHSPYKTHASRRGTCWVAAKMWQKQRKIGVFSPKTRSNAVSRYHLIAIYVSPSRLLLPCVFCSVFPLLLAVFRVGKPQDPKSNMAASLNEILIKFFRVVHVGGSRYTLPGPAPGVLDRGTGFCTGFPPTPAIPDIIHGC